METNLKLFIVLATMLAPMTCAHSWVEELTLLAPNGTFTGPKGYPRGMVQRSATFQDTMMQWLLPSNNSNQITPEMTICRQSQQTQNYTAGNPMLRAPAGGSIALRYQENGHVTQPWIIPNKPQGSGGVYVYGTTQPQAGDTLQGIYKKWTLDGTGGDGRGRLLTSQFFDDGQCYQVSDYPISVQRQQEFPRKAEPGSVEGTNLWCQTDVKLPSDLANGTNYTLYWVWDWSTLSDSNTVTTPQFYTTCMDVSIMDAAPDSGEDAVSFAPVTNYGENAISTIFESLTGTVTVPATLTPGHATSEAPLTLTTLPADASTATSASPPSSATDSVASQAGAAAPALQQSTQADCSATATVTSTTVSTSVVTATVTSTVTAGFATSRMVRRSQRFESNT